MRSLRNRLAFLFFAITLAAIGVLYLYVVPQLQSRLRDEKLSQLELSARQTVQQIADTVGGDLPAAAVTRVVRAASDTANARVTLLRIGRVGGLPLPGTITDSSDPRCPSCRCRRPTTAARSGPHRERLGGVRRTARSPRSPCRCTTDGRVAEVAVYSTPMADVERNVAVVRAQILVAGAIALTLAVAAGWLIARALAQRVKRLEKAAEQVAAGDFSRPIPVDSDDELGQLAVAFNDMQRQLAQLDRARKQFIATASHELRTPLFSLGGFVELLEDEDLDEETRARFLAQVRQQVDRLAKLSVDLLDLSRLEAGSLELRPSRSTCRSSRARSAPSSSRCSPSTTRTSRCGCPACRSRRSAIRCASRRSRGS